jgi:hypothetical protein
MATSKQSLKLAGCITQLGLLYLLRLSAKDFWEEKPFTQWTEKQAQKILSDSPWGKTQVITLEGSGPDLGGDRGIYGPTTPAGRPDGAAGGGGGTQTRTGSPGGLGGADAGSPGSLGGNREARTANFQVLWYSSTRVRQAMGRLGQLHGSVSEEQVNTFSQQPMENYVIAISGPMMKPFEEASSESLKANTFLASKKDKNRKAELKEYVSPKDRKDGLALFAFPRSLDGKPFLEVADEEAQFVTEQGLVRVRASFKLAKMMTNGKLDL